MKRLAFVLLLLLGQIATACYWDYDTLFEELNGKPNLQNAIVGRIELNPPEYYVVRIRLMKEKLSKNPTDLGAYDNIAVAFSRLGQHDEAIRWILDKRKHLGTGSDLDTYRTEANEGTFRLVRWMSQKAPKAGIEDAKLAREMIRKAIRINPDAHFGREKAQLLVMDWLIGLREGMQEISLANYVRNHGEDFDATKLYEGLAGLISLGAASESTDIIGAISGVASQDGNIAMLARLRVEELVGSGSKSFLLKPSSISVNRQPIHAEVVRSDYRRFRADAKAYVSYRRQFVLDKLAKGEHPDITPGFWDDFTPAEQPRATPPSIGVKLRRVFNDSAWAGMAILFSGVAILTSFLWIVGKKLAQKWKKITRKVDSD